MSDAPPAPRLPGFTKAPRACLRPGVLMTPALAAPAGLRLRLAVGL